MAQPYPGHLLAVATEDASTGFEDWDFSREAVAALWNAVEAADGGTVDGPTLMEGILRPAATSGPTEPPRGAVFDDDARAILDKARALAPLTTGDERIRLRQLLAAVFVAPPERVLAVFEEAGVDLAEQRDNLLDDILQNAATDSLEGWRRILLGTPEDTGSGIAPFHTDAPDGPDLLLIRRQVEPFARLLSARTVRPPLSVGLFGDWGSGKSFFMREIQKDVARRTKLARESGLEQRDLLPYKHVVQIEFNAWHYIGGNLWASLMTHILDGLRISPDEGPLDVEKRQREVLSMIRDEKQKLLEKSEEAQELRAQVEEQEHARRLADQRLNQLQAEITAGEGRLAAIGSVAVEAVLGELESDALDAQQRAEIEGALSEIEGAATAVTDTVGGLRTALADTRRQVTRGSKLFAPLTHAKDRGKRLGLLIVGVIAVPGLVGVAALWLLQSVGGGVAVAQATAAIATVTGWLGAGAAWLTRQQTWLRGWLDKVEAGIEAIDAKVGAELKQREAARDAIDRELEDLAERLRVVQGEETALDESVADLKTQLDRTTIFHLLTEYIEDRSRSDDYRRHLGLPALIRRDFDQITRAIAAQNEALETNTTLAEEQARDQVTVNRIILYIDDLDRCPPRRVVEVLQAVHLLLAFPLFVVVVGVDARWITRSLRHHYRELLGGDEDPPDDGLAGSASPQDYLEKIFQIPYWLTPMGPFGRLRMIVGLAKPVLERGVEAKIHPSAAGSETGAPEEDGGGDGEQRGKPAKGQGPHLAHGTSPADDPGPDPSLSVEQLSIDKGEFEFLQAVSPLLGHYPRSLKRFVNVYLLIRSGRAPALDRGSFLPDVKGDTRYRAVMFLCAAFTGLPALSTALHSALGASKRKGARESRPRQLGQLLTVLRKESELSAAALAELSVLESWIAHAEGGWDRAPLDVLAEEAPGVSRFTFRLGPVATAGR